VTHEKCNTVLREGKVQGDWPRSNCHSCISLQEQFPCGSQEKSVYLSVTSNGSDVLFEFE
jgi:hypothetical protein